MSLLKRRSQFYRMLATLEGAGLPRVRALEQSYPWPFDRAAHTMAALIGRQGVTLSEAMTEHPRLFSQFERSLVRVGEQTGRVEQVFRSLAEWYELVNRLRSQVIVLVAVLTGFAVAWCGMISFISLVAPHLVRTMGGPDQRQVIPRSMLMGGLLLLVADTVARCIAIPAEVPVGIFTALLGSPFFLILLRNARGRLA